MAHRSSGVWFGQQRQTVVGDERMRTVALNNDRAQYSVVLEKRAEDLIVDRHEANGQLVTAYFEKPGFREAFMPFLATSYEEIRGETVS